MREEIVEVQLLVGFAVEGLLDVFSIRDMPADGGVPAEREEVLVCAALLEVDVAAAVDDVEVDDRVQRLVRMVMHAVAGGLGDDVAVLVDDRQHLRGLGAPAAPEERRRGSGIDQLKQGVSSL